jgi:uncharacterized protein DUF4266
VDRTQEASMSRGRPAARRGVAPAALLVTLALLAGLAGCAPVEPWVKPYEREHLADPIMSLSRNLLAETYRDHMFETREGSRGATGAVGGGCGCN